MSRQLHCGHLPAGQRGSVRHKVIKQTLAHSVLCSAYHVHHGNTRVLSCHQSRNRESEPPQSYDAPCVRVSLVWRLAVFTSNPHTHTHHFHFSRWIELLGFDDCISLESILFPDDVEARFDSFDLISFVNCVLRNMQLQKICSEFFFEINREIKILTKRIERIFSS